MEAAVQATKTKRHDYRVTMLLRQASDDYAACRCSLIHRLFSGLELGATAVEKMLKALHKSSGLPAPQKGFGHDTDRIVTSLLPLYPSLSAYEPTFERLRTHYRARYPDADVLRSASTAEVHDIDEVMLAIYDLMPMDQDVLLRSSFMSGLFSRVVNKHELAEWFWVIADNRSLLPRLPAFEGQIRELHPES